MSITSDENRDAAMVAYTKDMLLFVSFKSPIVCQFPLQLPTDWLSVIIQAKYVISKSKLS